FAKFLGHARVDPGRTSCLQGGAMSRRRRMRHGRVHSPAPALGLRIASDALGLRIASDALRGGARFALGWCALCALGCAGGPPTPPTPEATVMAFARALNRAKLDEAYALMSVQYRKRVSLQQFKRQLESNPQETLEVGNALGHVRRPAEQEAVLGYGDD